jgi:hypothetical protein
MSCHSTPGNSAVTSLACALSRTPSDEVSRRFHALKHEVSDDATEPTLEEVLEWYEKQVLAVRNDEDLSAWYRERLLERLRAAIDGAEENLPDAATWYAWQNLRAACDEAHTHQWLAQVSGLPMPLPEAEPADIDGQLEQHWDKIYTLYDRRTLLLRDLQHSRRNLGRYGITEDNIARSEAKLAENQAAIDAEVDKTEPLEAEYLRRGRWARYYRVVTSGEGHVHSSRSCHSCYPTTRYVWLPTLSGQGELEAVDSYGRELCSHCFPNVLNHPSYQTAGRIAEEVSARRAVERAERDAVKAAKGIKTRDGRPVVLGANRRWREEIRTAVTAERTLVSKMAHVRGGLSDSGINASVESARSYSSDLDAYRERLLTQRREENEDIEILIDALAAKRGVPAAAVRAEFEERADKKNRRERRSSN